MFFPRLASLLSISQAIPKQGGGGGGGGLGVPTPPTPPGVVKEGCGYAHLVNHCRYRVTTCFHEMDSIPIPIKKSKQLPIFSYLRLVRIHLPSP